MPKFIGEDKMTPVQKALEHARFQLSFLHGHQIFNPLTGDTSSVIDNKATVALIDDALEYLATTSEPNTYP